MATITRFIIRIFLSPRALFPYLSSGSTEGQGESSFQPYSLPRTVPLSPPRPPLSPFSLPSYRRVHIVALPVVSNRRFEFLNIFRLPAPLCPCDLFTCSTSRSLPFGSLTLSLHGHVIIYCAAADGDCHRVFGARATGKKESVHGGNDFEIFVAAHKFEGGGLAYLNMGRVFLFFPLLSFFFFVIFAPLPPRPLLLLFRAPSLHLVLPLPFFHVHSSCSKLLPGSYLTASLLLFGSRPPLSSER